MLVVTSAGDAEHYVCYSSPAASNRVITAAGTRAATDTILQKSNFGDCIDVHAPGECVLSASDSSLCLQGSSSAAAIVAGVAAQLMTHISSQPKLMQYFTKLDAAERLRFLRQLVLMSNSGSNTSPAHELPYKSCSLPPLLTDTNELTNTITNSIKAFMTNRGARRIMDSVKTQMKLETKTHML